MSVIDKISRGLETASGILTEAAFGDIRNVIGGRTYSVGNVGKCAIGLANKDYLFMAEHLSRNIGNTEYTYDGYGTPIGILANPFYNTIVREPLYMDDEFKNGTPNYLEYIRTVYGDTIGLDNINNGDHFLYNDESMTPGVINTDIIGEYMVTGSEFGYGASYTNPNGFDTDTRLGVDGSFFAINTFRNSIVENDKRKAYLFGITEGVSNGFGISSNNIANTDLLTIEKRISEDTGRMEDLSSSLVNIESPVGNNKSYGNVYNLGSYQNFYDSLSEKSKQFYNDNISLNKFYPKINQNQNPNDDNGRRPDDLRRYRQRTPHPRLHVHRVRRDGTLPGRLQGAGHARRQRLHHRTPSPPAQLSRQRNSPLFREDNSSLTLGRDGKYHFIFTMSETLVDELPEQLVLQALAIAQRTARTILKRKGRKDLVGK